jgi:cellulose biosynthesis protein BcsQ
MIITVTNFCENIGKTSLVVFLSNYLIQLNKFQNVFVIDCGMDNLVSSIYHKEKENISKNIRLDVVTESNRELLINDIVLSNLNKSSDLYIVDLKANFEKEMLSLLKNSNFLIVPFANFSEVLKSTIEFGKLTKSFFDTEVFFLENFYDPKRKPDNNLRMELNQYGTIIEDEISKIANFKISFVNLNDQFRFKRTFDKLSYSLFD